MGIGDDHGGDDASGDEREGAPAVVLDDPEIVGEENGRLFWLHVPGGDERLLGNSEGVEPCGSGGSIGSLDYENGVSEGRLTTIGLFVNVRGINILKVTI